MTTSSSDSKATVPLRDVEGELIRQMKAVQGAGETPLRLARMSNLVIYCDSEDLAGRVAAEVPAIVALHPARVLLVVGQLAAETASPTASVQVRTHDLGKEGKVCSEQVTLRAQGQAVEHLPYAVRTLLIGDLPTNLWWASTQPPPMAGALLLDLSENVEQIIYDSIGWTEPARGVAATSVWLGKFQRGPGQGQWRVASDLNWRRLKYWRRLVVQSLDPASAPGSLDSITEVLVEHGPHAVVQAWELVSWLAARLNWHVQTGKVQPGVEIAWQVAAPHGLLRLRIHRLPEGPSEVRRLRISCQLRGKPGALQIATHGGQRLCVIPEGIDASIRTVTVQAQPLAELVARQLSDREQDPVFSESMTFAQVLAQSVLG
jgi:glucose-6-phosphate dehydrogenase assembly protein OpcA